MTSVRASSREWAIICMFSAKVRAMRVITARIARPASASDSALTRCQWS